MTQVPEQKTGVGPEHAAADGSLPVGHLDVPYEYIPAIPFWVDAGDPGHVTKTEVRLLKRLLEIEEARFGLTSLYTIGGETRTAYDFLFTGKQLALEKPEQFTLAWTTYKQVYESSKAHPKDLSEVFSGWLTDKTLATEHFWPTIASFGVPYNLLILKKVDSARADALAVEFGDAFDADGPGAVQAATDLYEIDTTITGSLAPLATGEKERFTPGALTILKQDPATKQLAPVAIKVMTTGGTSYAYKPGDAAWLYALQAAKTSITVYGVWLGHVYQWHIVTAAMQMAMYNWLPATHPLWTLLQPQSEFLIDFDYILLRPGLQPGLGWEKLAPPTPVGDPDTLLRLLDRFAKGRDFFADDPPTALERLGLEREELSAKGPWDVYPLMGFLLEIWDHAEAYVTTVVSHIYENDDKKVKGDLGLQQWLKACRAPGEGNVGSLPAVASQQMLIRVLTSFTYRVTAHGIARLTPTANPVLSFVANFPPCLQSKEIPVPSEALPLLPLLPHTDTIGEMAGFYYIFGFSKPYEPLIPNQGVDEGRESPIPAAAAPGNEALDEYRKAMGKFINTYIEAWSQALASLAGGSATIPPYAEEQEHQWPRSIET
jgi:hypothetical protein